MFIQNKKKKRWELSHSVNFERDKDKNFGETYSDVLFFGKYGLSSLKTIATFSKNVAINKKYVTKTVLFAAF